MIDILTNPCFYCENRHYKCHIGCEKYKKSLEVRAEKKSIENEARNKFKPFYTEAELKRHYRCLKYNGRIRVYER